MCRGREVFSEPLIKGEAFLSHGLRHGSGVFALCGCHPAFLPFGCPLGWQPVIAGVGPID
jgi:hypothetical protein